MEIGRNANKKFCFQVMCQLSSLQSFLPSLRIQQTRSLLGNMPPLGTAPKPQVRRQQFKTTSIPNSKLNKHKVTT